MKLPKHPNLRRRLAAPAALTAILAAISGFLVYKRATATLINESKANLSLLMTLRRSALERYLETTRSDLVLWSDHGPVRDALVELSAAWQRLGPDAETTLRRLYVDQNPFPPGSKQLYLQAPDGSAYSRIHASLQPAVQRYLSAQGYYDVFLCDADGNVLYTYFKEEDFGTSLIDGPWRDTGLAIVFRAASDPDRMTDFAFSDLELYPPTNDSPALFFAHAVTAEDGTLLGVLAIQASDRAINDIMHFTTGMGTTGETYIVGQDLLMRSNSRFNESPTTLRQTVDTQPVRHALAGLASLAIVALAAALSPPPLTRNL